MRIVKILERSISPSRGLYIRAAFWRSRASRQVGDRPHVESFHYTGLRKTRMTPETDGRGFYHLATGCWVDPKSEAAETLTAADYVMVQVTIDLREMVRRDMRRYVRGLTIADFNQARDLSDTRYRRSKEVVDDPDGLLTVTTDLEDQVIEEP